MFDDSMTLGVVKVLMRPRVDKGLPCPCCKQFVKVYRRKIPGRAAADLVTLHRRHGNEWFRLIDALGQRHPADFTKLRYWSLIEPKQGRRDDGSERNGWWRVTDIGERFVRGEVSVPKYARLYDGRCLGLIGDPTTIHDALGKKFRYDELMAGV